MSNWELWAIGDNGGEVIAKYFNSDVPGIGDTLYVEGGPGPFKVVSKAWNLTRMRVVVCEVHCEAK